ncbi:MAG: amidohydrolase family protein [Spirochaetaceae bacterium]|jgi:N-acyl-D-amino-acid deacylase|nr:amidohydrolase family protein [Spirochaetaceae bacterium]
MILLIRNGTIVDGSGDPPFRGDVLAEDGFIREIRPSQSPAGQELPRERAEETIDAGGRIVCPGFVDLHRHCDTAALGEDFGLIELSQGITSCFAGNCGMSPVPNAPSYREALEGYLAPCLGSFEHETFTTHREYLERLRGAALPLNMGFYAGMGAIRIAAKGFSPTPFTRKEMDAARGLLGDALDNGASGLSIGLMYVPELYSSADEIAALAQVMKGRKGILCTHMRWETSRLVEAVREVISIAQKAEVPLEISHFKAAGTDAWHGVLHRAIEAIEAERARGMDVTVDFYPYDCGSSTMMQMLPPGYLAVGVEKAIAGLNKSENVEKMRKLLAGGEKNWDNLSQTIGWDRTIISSVNREENRKFLGKSVTACVREYGYRDEAEMVARLMYSEQGKVAIINQSMSTEDIDTIARLSYSSLISDALYGDMRNPHPRLYGAFPRFLRDFVRERKVLDLPAAVHKMTAQPAKRVGLNDRGLLRPGCRADMLIFDPENFKDHADYLAPARLATGLDYAIIGGKTAYREGKLLCRNRGTVI